MEKQIEIKINPNGGINIELIGFHGDGCSKIAQQFIDALGKSVQNERKPEYYENNINNNCQHDKSI